MTDEPNDTTTEDEPPSTAPDDAPTGEPDPDHTEITEVESPEEQEAPA